MTSRDELFRAAGIFRNGPNLDAFTHRAYVDSEKEHWQKNLDSAPHGHPWHTSFHGSSFPGDDKSCGRKAIYTMMDVPEAEPAPPLLRATALMGIAAEQQILYRWGKAGFMIAGKPPKKDGESGKQQGFSDSQTWLSGSIDAILGLPGHPYVLPVDIKSKSNVVIDNMKNGSQSYFQDHYAQVQGYLYLCDTFYGTMGWEEMGYGRPIGATIYYVSRDNPRYTHEFYVDIDWPFINNGVANLKNWKQHWLDGTLPQRDKTWKWTDQPCKWCKFKKHACKPDVKANTVSIENSEALAFTKDLRTEYDFEAIKEGVTKRWS